MNSPLLLEKIALLKQRAGANRPAIAAIQQWLLAAHKFERIRIAPFTIASQAGMGLDVIVPELLHGVVNGVFDLYWDIHCPHCNMVIAEHNHLSEATLDAACPMCAMHFTADFAQSVEVTFSLNKEIEHVEMNAPCAPPPALQARFPMVLAQGEEGAAEESLAAGLYRYYCPITFAKGLLTVAGEAADEPQLFQVTQEVGPNFTPTAITARPGKIRFEVNNRHEPLSGFFVIDNDLPRLQPDQIPYRLSGLDLIHFPTFRALFGDQVLSKRERLQIASVTIMFTDIISSTRMYERLGDVVAYNIVRDHFDILAQAIQRRGGTIIKTIGDAVMASFITNEQALQGTLDALEDFQQYNQAQPDERRVFLKVSLHRGPALLVNLNGILDYFGSSINKAARIQAHTANNEIVFSAEVYQDEPFRRRLSQVPTQEVCPETVNLKGVEGPQVIYRARLA
jgi:class 3 adenylate cyclase